MGYIRGKWLMELKLKLVIYRCLYKDFVCEFLEKLVVIYF